MDLSKLSDSDLQAISSGDMSKVSNEGLAALSQTDAAPDESNLPWYNKTIPVIGVPLIGPAGPMADLRHGAGLAIHMIAHAIAGMPLAAEDAGVGARNALMGENNELPSQTFSKGLSDLGVPSPQGGMEKTADFAGQVLLGSKLPSPTGAGAVPANFVANASQKALAQKAALDSGVVAPPSTTNPSTFNRGLEGLLAGKYGMQDAATAKNAQWVQTQAKQALGLHPDTPLNQQVLGHIYDEATQSMSAVANSGMMRSDKWYNRALDDILQNSDQAGKFSESLKDTNLEKVVSGLKFDEGTQFTAESATAALRQLRAMKSTAYAQGDSTLGAAYGKAASAVENLIQRNLEKKANVDITAANGSPDILQAARQAAETLANFKNSRKLIAKASEVEKAMNPTTGEVNALTLAKSPNADAFTDGLAKIRDAANTLPKVMGPVKGSGAVSQLEGMLGAGGAIATHNPYIAAVPWMRDLMRQSLLTNPMQKALAQPFMPAPSAVNPSTAQGVATGIASLFQNQGQQ